VKEVGYDMAVYSPLGLVGPKGMDPAVVTRLQNAFRKATSDPAYLKVLDDYDLQPRLMSAEGCPKYAGEQFARDKVLLSPPCKAVRSGGHQHQPVGAEVDGLQTQGVHLA